MRINEGLVGLVIENGEPVVVDRRDQPSALQIFSRDRRRALSHLSRRAGAGRAATSRSACWWCRRCARRKFTKSEVRLLQDRGQPGRADPFALPAARDPRHQGKGARRVSPADDRGQPPAQGLREGRRQDPASRRRSRFAARAWSDLPAAPGFAHGIAHVVGTFLSTIDRNLRARDIRRPSRSGSKRRWRARCAELGALKARMAPLMPESDLKIFDGHRHDPRRRGIRRPHPRHRSTPGYAAESALFRVIDELSAQMLAVADGYLRERATDFRDVGHRVLRHLRQEDGKARRSQADHPRRRGADALAADAGLARKPGRYRAAVGRRDLARRDPGARLRNSHRGRRRASDGIGDRGRHAGARRQLGHRLRQSERPKSNANTSAADQALRRLSSAS